MKKCCLSCEHCSEIPFSERIRCEKGEKPTYSEEKAYNQYCEWWKPTGERKR